MQGQENSGRGRARPCHLQDEPGEGNQSKGIPKKRHQPADPEASKCRITVKQAENLEAALWVALRMMEERKNLIKKLEEQTRGRGFSRFANDYKEKHEELQFHIDKIKELLFITQKDDDT